MKDCRYCYDNNFINYYSVIDNYIRVFYGDGTYKDFVKSFEKEKEILLLMEEQIKSNLLFKKVRKKEYYLSRIIFPFCVIFSCVSIDRIIDNFYSLENIICLLGSFGVSAYDFYSFFSGDSCLREINKEQFYVKNKNIFDICSEDLCLLLDGDLLCELDNGSGNYCIDINTIEGLSFNELKDIKKRILLIDLSFWIYYNKIMEVFVW